ncbi:MAG: hypothetical protein K2Y40_22280 [Reyranella sp.]|nr:hypothetical protein [Reyranella sp.]
MSRPRRPTPAALGLSAAEAAVFRKLTTPERIQAFVTALRTNFERGGDTLLSVRRVIARRHAHCIEAAFVAACGLWLLGEPPLLMDLQAEGDSDHVVALFRRDGCWGAISKSNHVWLRWRDPVYRSPRELAMSYFHEYCADERKTLRTYSRPFDLSRLPTAMWITNSEECWEAGARLDDSRHYRLITRAQARRLAPRDATERRAGDLVQFESRDRRTARKY